LCDVDAGRSLGRWRVIAAGGGVSGIVVALGVLEAVAVWVLQQGPCCASLILRMVASFRLRMVRA
jgi:hypothetical protein